MDRQTISIFCSYDWYLTRWPPPHTHIYKNVTHEIINTIWNPSIQINFSLCLACPPTFSHECPTVFVFLPFNNEYAWIRFWHISFLALIFAAMALGNSLGIFLIDITFWDNFADKNSGWLWLDKCETYQGLLMRRSPKWPPSLPYNWKD